MFWTQKSKFWSDASIEPKRPYRHVLPIPLIAPKTNHAAAFQYFSEHFRSNGDISRLNRWGSNNLFEFPVISCTKPGFKTEAYRTTNGAGGFPRIRPGQPSVYTFTPVIMEIIDTVSHDLEATITALLYARGQLKSADELKNNPDAGRLISFGNTVEAGDGTCGSLVQANLVIYEVNPESTFIPSFNSPTLPQAPFAPFISPGRRDSRARALKLINSHIVGAELGTFDYRDTEFSTVRLTIDYDSYDYRMSTMEYVEPVDVADAAQNIANRRAERQHTRDDISIGRAWHLDQGKLDEAPGRPLGPVRLKHLAGTGHQLHPPAEE
jgi:hypothetical protein